MGGRSPGFLLARLAMLSMVACSSGFVLASAEGRVACLSLYDEFDAMTLRCELKGGSPPREMCDYVTSYDPQRLGSECLPWLRELACDSIVDETFTDEMHAHCDGIFTLADL